MKKFIKEFTKLPIYFSDEGVTYKTVLETSGSNSVSISINILAVEKFHKDFETFENFGAIHLKHSGHLQGYLFDSSNFIDEKGGLEAIAELLEFVIENNYKTLINEYKNNLNNVDSTSL